MLSDRPAVLAGQVGQQATHERPGPPAQVGPAKAPSDPAPQLLQHLLPAGRVYLYAVACGHRLIFGCVHNTGSSTVAALPCTTAGPAPPSKITIYGWRTSPTVHPWQVTKRGPLTAESARSPGLAWASWSWASAPPAHRVRSQRGSAARACLLPQADACDGRPQRALIGRSAPHAVRTIRGAWNIPPLCMGSGSAAIAGGQLDLLWRRSRPG
jgi:hypothetical protein